ncbi:MAG: hypothetical protein ACLUD0_07115 [Eubacterium ramulus]
MQNTVFEEISEYGKTRKRLAGNVSRVDARKNSEHGGMRNADRMEYEGEDDVWTGIQTG